VINASFGNELVKDALLNRKLVVEWLICLRGTIENIPRVICTDVHFPTGTKMSVGSERRESREGGLRVQVEIPFVRDNMHADFLDF
jgi:hypothetical protein